MHKLHILRVREIAERELQHVVEAGLNRLACNGQAVIRQTDEPDFPLPFCLEHRLVKAGAVSRLRAERGIVKLIHINIVRVHQTQARLEILPEPLRRLRRRFCRNVQLLAQSVPEGRANLFLAVSIAAGCIEIADSAFVGFLQQGSGGVKRDTLNRQSAEPVFFHFNACSSQ